MSRSAEILKMCPKKRMCSFEADSVFVMHINYDGKTFYINPLMCNKKYFYECLKMGHGVKELIHLDACLSEFAFHFLQNYTVKIFDSSYSNSQDYCE